MSGYRVHDIDSAPEASRPLLEKAKARFGFVPNLLGMMSESPALLKAYMQISDVFERTSFTHAEKQVILLSVSRHNKCEYCMGAHSAIAEMLEVPAKVITAVREDKPIGDRKLEALRRFVAVVVDTRGWPGEDNLEAFLAAGYTRAQVFEVLVGVGQKTLSNYMNHIAGTPLDAAFEGKQWSEAG